MPFVAACPFCPARLKADDHLLGMSLRCPKCGNQFTAAAMELASFNGPVIKPARPEPEPAPPPVPEAPPAADLPWWIPPASGAPAAPPVPSAAPPAEPSEPSAGPVGPPAAPAADPPPTDTEPAVAPPRPALPGWINAWGAVALFLAGLALLFAALALPRYVTLPLAGLGLVVGLVGVAALEDRTTKDTVWLSLGGGGSALVLIVALFLPSWLNSQWGRDFDVPDPDAGKSFEVSRDNKKVVRQLTGGERIETPTNAFRQGDVLVRVDAVVVDREPEKDRPALLIRLHVGNVGPLREFTYRGQAGGEAPAVVRDSRGKELPRYDLGSRAKKAGQVGTVSVLPLHEIDDLLVCEPPWPGTEYLELDLPAAAWGGGEGGCKFKIPSGFILHAKRRKGGAP